MHGTLTDITVYVELDVGIIRPDDSVYACGEELPEQPEAQESDTEVPALSDEAGQEHEKKHDGRYKASDRVERVCRVERMHGVV